MRDLIKRLLYGTGALSLYHRLRNARTLTVVMYHRVLAPSDPRWTACDPDYTLSVDLFASSLAFFRRHYNVVSPAQVLDAKRTGARLPPRALLITFDDGWSDNVDYALPQLERAGLPAVVFTVADAVDRPHPFFQERIVAAWRRGGLPVARLASALADAGVAAAKPAGDTIAALRALIAVLEQAPADAGANVLAALLPQLDAIPDAMVTAAQLRLLEQRGVTIGAHGESHDPLTRVPDAGAELRGAREKLARHLQAAGPNLMSFPHGRFNGAIVGDALAAGYELLFTSVPAVNDTRAALQPLIARVGVETETLSDESGRYRPDLLALNMFNRPRRSLAA